MKTLFRYEDRIALLGRIRRLEPSNRRRWGRLTAPAMVAHVSDQLRMALGDIPTSPPRGPMRFAWTRVLIIYLAPWPRGKTHGPPEAFSTRPTSWEGDRQRLVRLVERFATADPSASWPTHPLFGAMSGRDWGVLSHRHLNHHLRQFSA